MDFNAALKVTMDKLKVKSKDLATLSGRGADNISGIRTGRVSPSTKEFGKLVEQCEQLHPGFKQHFACELVGAEDFFFLDQLSPDDVARMLSLFADRYKAMSQQQPKEEELAIAA